MNPFKTFVHHVRTFSYEHQTVGQYFQHTYSQLSSLEKVSFQFIKEDIH